MNEKLKAVIEEHKVMVAAYDCYSEDDWHYEEFQEGMKDYLKMLTGVDKQELWNHQTLIK